MRLWLLATACMLCGVMAADRLRQGKCLQADGCLESASKGYRLCFRTDGSPMAVYNSANTSVWDISTSGIIFVAGNTCSPPDKLCLQDDGNLVLVSSGSSCWGAFNDPEVLMRQRGPAPAQALLLDDGSLQLFDAFCTSYWDSTNGKPDTPSASPSGRDACADRSTASTASSDGLAFPPSHVLIDRPAPASSSAPGDSASPTAQPPEAATGLSTLLARATRPEDPGVNTDCSAAAGLKPQASDSVDVQACPAAASGEELLKSCDVTLPVVCLNEKTRSDDSYVVPNSVASLGGIGTTGDSEGQMSAQYTWTSIRTAQFSLNTSRTIKGGFGLKFGPWKLLEASVTNDVSFTTGKGVTCTTQETESRTVNSGVTKIKGCGGFYSYTLGWPVDFNLTIRATSKPKPNATPGMACPIAVVLKAIGFTDTTMWFPDGKGPCGDEAYIGTAGVAKGMKATNYFIRQYNCDNPQEQAMVSDLALKFGSCDQGSCFLRQTAPKAEVVTTDATPKIGKQTMSCDEPPAPATNRTSGAVAAATWPSHLLVLSALALLQMLGLFME